MFENFRFETFVDVHSNIFEEYLSSVIAKLPKENPEYRAISDKIESLYEQYPKIMAVLDAVNYADIPLVGKTIFEQQGLLYQALLEWLDTFESQFKES